MTNIIKHILVPKSDEWLNLRRTKITATEVWRLFGLDTRRSIFADLRDKKNPKTMKDNQILMAGRVFEDSNIAVLKELGYTADKAGEGTVFLEDTSSLLGSSLDGVLVIKDKEYPVECKYTSTKKFIEYSSKMTIQYLLQLQVQMYLMGVKKGLLSMMSIGAQSLSAGNIMYVPMLKIFKSTLSTKIISLIKKEADRAWKEFEDSDIKRFKANEEYKDEVLKEAYNNIVDYDELNLHLI